MNENEHPINLIYDGIADLLVVKGETINISDDGLWKVISISYGGYIYTILKHNGEIINIHRNLNRVYYDTDDIKYYVNATYGILKENPYTNGQIKKAITNIKEGRQ